MPADTSVKFFHSAMTGAPSLTNAAGSMIALLDACLINGFGTGTVDSVVVTSNVATVTRTAGHPFEVGSVALIAGATPAGLNGEKKVLSVTTTSYTFEAAGIGNQTATGTITHKTAPLGWVKQFSGTNLAAYKSSDIQSTGCLLRVDDTLTTNPRVAGYLSMSDVNTGLGRFPTDTQRATGPWWMKSNNASAVPWAVIGDGRLFYIYSMPTTGTSTERTACFGDFKSYKLPDPYACVIVADQNVGGSTENSGVTGSVSYYSYTITYGDKYLARPVTGVGSAVPAIMTMPTILSPNSNATFSGVGSSSVRFPNLADNRLYVWQTYIGENVPFTTLRGGIPGLYHTEQNVLSSFSHLQRITDIDSLPGRQMVAFKSTYSLIFFDTTGPWR